jgi:hypothetical protein
LMSMSVELHLSGGGCFQRVVSYRHVRHCGGAIVGGSRGRPMSGRDQHERPVTGKRPAVVSAHPLRSRS